jgi:methyl-accepting chemotaxis protein
MNEENIKKLEDAAKTFDFSVESAMRQAAELIGYVNKLLTKHLGTLYNIAQDMERASEGNQRAAKVMLEASEANSRAASQMAEAAEQMLRAAHNMQR